MQTGIDDWINALAPSVALRKWFGHDPDKWIEFRKMYRAELRKNRTVEFFLDQNENRDVITLVYATQDAEHNHTLVLQEYLSQL